MKSILKLVIAALAVIAGTFFVVDFNRRETRPILIDYTDTKRNLERTGRSNYLYFVRAYQGRNRDLIRMPITFTKTSS